MVEVLNVSNWIRNIDMVQVLAVHSFYPVQSLYMIHTRNEDLYGPVNQSYVFLLYYVSVWIPLKLRLHFTSCVFILLFYFLGFHAFWSNVDFFIVNSAFMHCLRTHKFHFSANFSLKMGLTVLFTHLKIILLQCFQFSVLAK